MFKNYIKIAWRNLWKNKLFSFINIFGLAIGISCCVLIFLYVQYELSYDSFNEKADRLFRITSDIHDPKKEDRFAPTAPVTSEKIRMNFPEVEKIVRFSTAKQPMTYKDRKFSDVTVLYADSTLFDVFTFPLVSGDAVKALAAPNSLVLTETAQKRYFGEEPAVGKIVKFADTVNLMVTAVIKDVPQNSHLKFDGIISRATYVNMNKVMPDWEENFEKNWLNCNSYAYLLMKKRTDPKLFEAKVNQYLNKETEDIKKSTGMWVNVGIQPVRDIHLRSNFEHEMAGSSHGNIVYVYIFSATALLILLIACCNFINLSTARSLNRSKEIGLRKVIGAARGQLIMQFMGESVVFTLIACIISLLFILPSLPLFNAFMGTTLSLTKSAWLAYPVIIMVIGCLAGLYPAFLMSSFNPVQSLKGKINHGAGDVFFRKGLVVFQFSIAIMLIVATTVILKQLDFIQKKNLGINKEQVVGIELKGPDKKRADVFLKELGANAGVIKGSLNGFSFKGIPNITLIPEGSAKNEMTACNVFSCDEDFLSTMKVQVVAGRDFSKSFPSDVNDAFIVNEAAVKAFGWKIPKNAIGKKVEWGMGKNGRIIGVVKDFNYTSLHQGIEPVLINIFRPWFNTITLRLSPNDISSTMSRLEASWKNLSPENTFKYTFLDDDFKSLYKAEENMRTILSTFTFLSVLVACLGLFGLAAFTIKQRFKEIGIRKVLGANVSSIISLLSKDFLKLVLVAVVIASPLAFYAAHTWLQDFAYRISIEWWIFLIAAAAALLIAFLTVSFQALRAANANPVKSIRTE